MDKNNALGVDLGINNLVTCVSSFGGSFIIDGKKLKSINQWFNKENSRLQSIKDKQKFGKENTNLQASNWNNRNNRVDDYLNKTVNTVINYDMSIDAEAYVHRVGRAGRFGTKGITITFLASDEDQKVFDELLKKYPNIRADVLPDVIDKSIYSKYYFF